MIAKRVKSHLALLVAIAGLGLPLAPLPMSNLAPETVPAAEDGTAEVPVAIVAPLVVPPGNSAFIDAETLEEYTLPGGLLDRQLTDIAATGAILGIDPRVLASIRILGHDAPASALDWLDRLESVANETFPLAWADADLVSPLRAGATTILTPKPLESAIDPARFDGEQEIEATPTTATPTPTDDPVLPLPTHEELTDWNYTWPHLAWPARGTLVPGDLALLEAEGYDGAILQETDLSLRGGDGGPATVVEGERVVTADSVLSDYLGEAVTAPTTADWSAATAQLSLALAAVSSTDAGQAPPVLLTLDRAWPNDHYRLADTVAAIMAQPWVTSATLADAFSGSAAAGELAAVTSDVPRIEKIGNLLTAEEREVRFLGIVADPLRVTAPRRAELLTLLSNAWLADPEGWADATEEFLLRSEAIRSSVQIADSSTITLLSDRAALPVTVSNTLDQPVTVYIEVQPQSALLSVENPRVELLIEPNSSNKGTVPVKSLSNGQVTVSVRLFDVAGNRIGDATEVELNVYAGWETAGTLFFAGLVVAVFAFGLVRNIRKRRRERNV